jgi:hypothetical protein
LLQVGEVVGQEEGQVEECDNPLGDKLLVTLQEESLVGV